VKVPLLDLKGEFVEIESEVRAAIDAVLAHRVFVLGPEVEALERRIAAEVGVGFGIAMSSGTDALLCSLMALGVGPGDEVITTPFTFFGTAGVVARLGATPVFADIDPGTFNIHPAAVEGAITKKTKAILPVHLYGQCADMDPILAMARERSIAVVEDAAQAIGAQYRGRASGGMGDMGCFSFYPTKNLSAFGDAGMVVTDDAELADRCRLLRIHGSAGGYNHHLIGGNFRMDAIQGSVLGVKLNHLATWNRRRQEHADAYNAALAGAPLLTPIVMSGSASVYHQYVVRVKNRDSVRSRLTELGVSTGLYYPIPLHLQACFKYLGQGNGSFPESEKAAAEVMALPVYPQMIVEQRQHVIDSVLRAVAGASTTVA
jgi:dTDP-4-amino-4,6-dideoxygalactose transaminase